MKKGIFSILFVLTVVIFVSSCKPQVPSKYLQPDEMEDILFDYHIAMGMISDKDTCDFQKRLYEISVLKSHGVSEADFDSSLVYYTRHADRFQAIYENLSKRLSDEAVSLGASASDVGNFGSAANTNDTANIWKETASYVLTTEAPYNVESFALQADTAYHKGDKFIFSFDTQFIFQDGYKDGIAMMAVRFSNDSVATRVVHISESSHYDVVVSDDDRLGVKEIRGFICLQNPPNSSSTTMRLMFVSNIRLIKCHTKETVLPSADNNQNSGNDEKVSDSVMPKDVDVKRLPMRKLGSVK